MPLHDHTPDEQAFWDAAVCAALSGLASHALYVDHATHFPLDLAGDAVRVADALLAIRRDSRPEPLPAPMTRREGNVLVTTYPTARTAAQS